MIDGEVETFSEEEATVIVARLEQAILDIAYEDTGQPKADDMGAQGGAPNNASFRAGSARSLKLPGGKLAGKSLSGLDKRPSKPLISPAILHVETQTIEKPNRSLRRKQAKLK